MSKTLLDRLYNNLPKNFRAEDALQRQQLKRYLDILTTGGIEPLHEETKGLLNLIDLDNIPAKYLPHLASDLGFRFPYNLDEQTQRTYIKNAVASYRMKGTRKALLFMLRELTKFIVTLSVNEDEKSMTVFMEVDFDRQDLELLQDKVRFIVNEYSPPYRQLNLINLFMWEEFFNNRTIQDEANPTYLTFYDTHDDNSTLYLNSPLSATLNSLDHNLSSFQQYNRNRIRYHTVELDPEPEPEPDFYVENYVRIKDDSFLLPTRISSTEENTYLRSLVTDELNYFTIQFSQLVSTDYKFVLTSQTSTTLEERNQISGSVERWTREKYAIIGKDNQSEFSNQEALDTLQTQDDHTDVIRYLHED